MLSKLKKLAFLTMIAVVILSVLGLAKYIDMQPKQIVSGLTSMTTPLQMHLQTQIKPIEHLSATKKICFSAFIFLLITVRASMIRKGS